jgi:hypothetical protein
VSKALDGADLGRDRKGEHPADPRRRHQRDVGVIGVACSQAAVDPIDPALEVVDQLQRRGDVAPPGLGDVEPRPELSALDPERVGDRAGAAEVDRGRVDPVLSAPSGA